MRRPATVAVFLFAATVCSQIISNLPHCWQSCIHNSGDFNCNDLDIPCICRLSNGNFLTDVVTCVKSNCDYQLDTSLFITPLQLACSLSGSPISSAAIRNAEFVETSGRYGAQQTTIMTTTLSEGSQTVSTKTITATPAIRTTTTVSTTTDSRGNTFYIIVPLTVQQGSTSTSSVTDTTALVGAEAGSTSTVSQSATGTAESTLSSSTSTTTVTPSSTTTSTMTTTSVTNAAANSPVASTNGSPFGMQNVGTRKEGSSWLGLTVGLIAGVVWF